MPIRNVDILLDLEFLVVDRKYRIDKCDQGCLVLTGNHIFINIYVDVSHIWASNCPNFQRQTPCTNEKDLPFMSSMTDLIGKALLTAESVARRLAEEERARKEAEEARIKRSVINP